MLGDDIGWNRGVGDRYDSSNRDVIDTESSRPLSRLPLSRPRSLPGGPGNERGERRSAANNGDSNDNATQRHDGDGRPPRLPIRREGKSRAGDLHIGLFAG